LWIKAPSLTVGGCVQVGCCMNLHNFIIDFGGARDGCFEELDDDGFGFGTLGGGYLGEGVRIHKATGRPIDLLGFAQAVPIADTVVSGARRLQLTRDLAVRPHPTLRPALSSARYGGPGGV